MKAMRTKDFSKAIDLFDKAEQDLSADCSADEPALLAEISTQSGIAHLELAEASKNYDRRQLCLIGARRHFGRARGRLQALHGANSLEYANATERLADARAATAENSNQKLQPYLGALAADATTKESAADLYFLALTIREQRLGERDPDVIHYRRKILRQFRTWLRTCNALRRDVTDIKVQYAYDPIIEAYKAQADELRKRHRALSKSAEVTTNGEL